MTSNNFLTILLIVLLQVTLEEQMICGTLKTLNEEALEDVLGSDSIQSPTGEGSLLIQQLAPICESSEFSSPPDDASLNAVMSLQTHPNSISRNNSPSSFNFESNTIYQSSRPNTPPPPPSLTPSNSSVVINMVLPSQHSSQMLRSLVDDTRL